jgi:hypothetical protein
MLRAGCRPKGDLSVCDGAHPIKRFNHGERRCDFAYIDDVTRVILCLVDHIPQGNNGKDARPRLCAADVDRRWYWDRVVSRPLQSLTAKFEARWTGELFH